RAPEPARRVRSPDPGSPGGTGGRAAGPAPRHDRRRSGGPGKGAPVSDVVSLLADLRARDVRVSLVDAELEIDAPDGALTEGDLQALRAHKPALLEFMAGRGAIGRRLVVPLTRRDQCGMLPVSMVQRRLWFVERLGNGGSAYCMIGRIR